MADSECTIEGCSDPVFVKSRGWCRKHYSRWHRHGDPLKTKYDRAQGSDLERWWSKVEQTDTCWLWKGSLDRHGYGQFDTTGGGHKNHRAHRWGYQALIRPLDETETLDHLCRVHACVNPAHLEPVLHAENVARGLSGWHNAIKTHCSNGHEFAENMVVNDKGWRTCIICRRTASKAASRRRRGTAPDAAHNGEKTHCKNGHEFTEDNTYRRPAGGRQCRECGRVKVREYMRKKRASA